ncbi:MAG: 3-oxoadipate enol-lactonase [Streptosporangiales bacterium]|nr:3-oxoadipate enol-lactonase [Streptosporangiales bacterium]
MTSAVRLHHVIDGPSEAPVLVLVGSLGSTLRMWDPLLAAFGDRYRVVRLDHRGHGGSPVPPGPYTADDLGTDVLALLDELGLERVSFAGLSIGGLIGQWLALNAPHRLERLVLMCTSAKFGPPEPWRERAATVRAGGARAVASTVVERWFTQAYAAERPDVVADAIEMISATPAEGYAACCDAIAAWDVTARLGEILVPTLVIAGAHDPATPPEHAQVLAAGIPGARSAVIGDAAHLAAWERPDEVAALLTAHMDGSGPANGRR